MKTTTIIIGALLIGGGLYLYSEHQKAAAQQGPTLEDQANKALASETNPYTLRALAVTLEADVSMLAAQIASNSEDVYGQWDSDPVDQPRMLPGDRA